MTAYYNEIDPYCAQWLRNLIAAGHIAAGDVDERDIRDVTAADLAGYVQCHFFAGIGGWSHALRLAGWPDDRPVWTGSCPCQPFSAAGKGRGFDDERHLWPEWFRLISECCPSVVFGEQVASKPGLTWLDVVQTDMEGADYAVGALDLCAAAVGAPHWRSRLWFVAHAECRTAERQRLDIREEAGGSEGETRERERVRFESRPGSAAKYVAHSESGRFTGWIRAGRSDREEAVYGRFKDAAWEDLEWIHCRDGVARPTQPGLFPLAHGVPARVGRLRAYGNAIVPQVAAEFVCAASSGLNCQHYKSTMGRSPEVRQHREAPNQ